MSGYRPQAVHRCPHYRKAPLPPSGAFALSWFPSSDNGEPLPEHFKPLTHRDSHSAPPDLSKPGGGGGGGAYCRSTRTVPADLPTRSRSKPQTSCNEPSDGVRLTDRAEGHAMSNANDDRSPLIDLLTCKVCSVTMQIANSVPEAEGSELVQYRCELCGKIELVRLLRRSRDAA